MSGVTLSLGENKVSDMYRPLNYLSFRLGVKTKDSMCFKKLNHILPYRSRGKRYA